MAGRQLKELFRAYREGDELAFRRAAQEIIEEEEAKQHIVLARDLRRIIAGPTTVQVGETCQLPPPPTDREGEWSLAEPRIPSRYLSDLVLHHATEAALEGLSREVPRWEALDQRGIPRRQRVLFYGPPGTGKTSAAEGLAAEIGLRCWSFASTRSSPPTSARLHPTCGGSSTTSGRAHGWCCSMSSTRWGRHATILASTVSCDG